MAAATSSPAVAVSARTVRGAEAREEGAPSPCARKGAFGAAGAPGPSPCVRENASGIVRPPSDAAALASAETGEPKGADSFAIAEPMVA